MDKKQLEEAVKERVEEINLIDSMSNDLNVLLNAIPKGQVKQLYKDETCSSILSKYNIKEEQ